MTQAYIAIILAIVAFLVSIGTTEVIASVPQEANQSQITWKTFTDRDNLFTVRYPTDWVPSGVEESMRAGPIDTLFYAPYLNNGSWASVNVMQYASQSVFRTANESLQSKIDSLHNNPTLTKFEIERPLECSTYTLNGLQACSVIYEIATPEGGSSAVMRVVALSPEGDDFEVLYGASFDSFEHFFPIAENITQSFQSTEGASASSDFSLSNSGIGDSNATPGTTASANLSVQHGANSSNNDGFSLS